MKVLIALFWGVALLSSGAKAQTVRHPHEWEFDATGKGVALRYVHEIWDTDWFGFSFHCEKGNNSFVELNYDFLPKGKTLDARIKRGFKPTAELNGGGHRLTVRGKIDTDDMYPRYSFLILSGPDVKELISSKDASIKVEAREFRWTEMKNSGNITKFVNACF